MIKDTPALVDRQVLIQREIELRNQLLELATCGVCAVCVYGNQARQWHRSARPNLVTELLHHHKLIGDETLSSLSVRPNP